MDPIIELAHEHGLKVVEDCAQAHGATYKGRPVGCLGDAAAFSFCQDKIMSTGGEGGMMTTDDHELWERAWSFKDHGKAVTLHISSKLLLGFVECMTLSVRIGALPKCRQPSGAV